MKGDAIMSTSSSVCPRNSCAGGYGNCLDVKITNVCNCRCAFCIERGGFSPKEQKSPVELATATISKQDFKNVLILGGEPLMYPHLLQYLELIRPFKEHIYLTTNGTMLNSQHMSRSDMEKLGKCLDGINISIHHYTEKKNDLVLKGGIESNAPAGHLSFSALKEAIAILQANGCNVRINSNLVKGFIQSKYGIAKMVELTEELGAKELRFTELQNSPNEFVDAYTIFDGLPTDPYTQGCEVNLKEVAEKMSGTIHKIASSPVNIRLKLTCGRVNPLRKPVNEQPKRSGETHVLYPNGLITKGWVDDSDNCHSSNRKSMSYDNCHGRA